MLAAAAGGLCWLCKKYGVSDSNAVPQLILLTQPAKPSLLPLLLPTLLLLKPLLLLTSQMATLGLPDPARGLPEAPGSIRHYLQTAGRPGLDISIAFCTM